MSPADGADVGQSSPLTEAQGRVASAMRDLEDHLLDLAKLLQEVEPDDAKRLELAFGNAREEMILERMIRAVRLLQDGRLGDASGHQQVVLDSLRQLKGVMLGGEVTDLRQLKRLNRLNELRHEVAELIRREQRQIATARHTEEQSDMSALQQNELDHQQAASRLQEQARQLGESAQAASALRQAERAMSDAVEALQRGAVAEAVDAQRAAVENLSNADKQLDVLEQAMQRLLNLPGATRTGPSQQAGTDQNRSGQNATRAADQSGLRREPGAPAKLQESVADDANGRWARLAPKQRDRILQSRAEGFPAELHRALADYFRQLAEVTFEKQPRVMSGHQPPGR